MTASVNYKRPMRTSRAAVLLLLAIATASVRADYVRPVPQKIELAKGIYLFVSKPYGDVGLDGNSIAILSSDGVLVFDTNGTPASSAAVLAEIRELTDQPVRYVVNSHWHWDHWYGTEVYTQAFPRRAGHRPREDARDDGGPGDRVQPARRRAQLPGYIATLERRAAAGSVAAAAARGGPVLPRAEEEGAPGPAGDDVHGAARRCISASGRSRSCSTTARSRRATRSCICPRRRSSSPAICS